MQFTSLLGVKESMLTWQMCATSPCLNSGLLLTEISEGVCILGYRKKRQMQTTGNMCFDLQEPLRQWCKEQDYGRDVHLAEFLGG